MKRSTKAFKKLLLRIVIFFHSSSFIYSDLFDELIILLKRHRYFRYLLQKTSKRNRSEEIIILPGYRLASFIRFFYSKKIRERVFDQILADSRDDYLEVASRNGSKQELRMVYIRTNGSLLLSAIIQPLESLLKKVKDIWKIG